AFHAWGPHLRPLYPMKEFWRVACLLGEGYLQDRQRPDGSWLPLWFGCQHADDDVNPTYGTSRVLAAYRDLGLMDREPARRGGARLLAAQNADGGWGGDKGTPSSVEETALALEALLAAVEADDKISRNPAAPPGVYTPGASLTAVNNGLSWLVHKIEA